jgi:hypothetical protein
MEQLQPCSTCHRHQRADSQRCPFCGARAAVKAVAFPLIAAVGLTACPDVKAVYAGPPPEDTAPRAEAGDAPVEPADPTGAPDVAEDDSGNEPQDEGGDGAPEADSANDSVAPSDEGPPVRAIYAGPPPRDEPAPTPDE